MREWLAICIVIWSCTKTSETEAVEADSVGGDSVLAIDSNRRIDNHENRTDSVDRNVRDQRNEIVLLEVPEISALPFGCGLLAGHRFPEEWEVDPYDTLKLPHEQEYEDLMQCFNTLHIAPTVFLPSINKLERIKIGDYDTFNFDDSLFRSIDNCKYRLPDFGIYECYYVYNHNPKAWRSGPYCSNAGSLVLYNPISKDAKILNIYFKVLFGDSYSINRLFYVHEDKTIEIFDGFTVELGNGLKSKFLVNVQSDGQIDVKEK